MLTDSDTRALPVPAEAIDIGEWLFSLTDEEYRASARAHVGAGTFEAGDGRRGFFDTEAFPWMFIVNHHLEEEARRDYVRVRSRDSRGWLLRVIPMRLEVCWEMAVRPRGSDESELECRLHVGLGSRPLERVARLIGVPVAQRRHMREQMTGFARSVVARYGG